MLWPKFEVWPRDGEIDFPEGDLNGSIKALMHRQNGSSGGDQDEFRTSATSDSWHTSAVEWKPGSCEFFLDGKSIGKSTDRIPNTPMRWVQQTETELNSAYPSKTSIAKVQVDYVRVWRYVP